jgi:glycosyltransferase involved in cell wall biosynthesis
VRLLFFGTGVPLHGLPTLVEAAAACAGAVELEVIGGSVRERAAITALASPHVRLGPPFVDSARLQQAIAAAHVVCGVFGASGKAQRVIPFKVVHALAAGRPVLTGDTAAVRAWLRPPDEILVAPVADAAALTRCLLGIAADRGRLPALAAAARGAYERAFSPAALAARAAAVVAAVLPHREPRLEAVAHA